MLALLNELRTILGRRGFLARRGVLGVLGFLVLAMVGVTAFEVITNVRAYVEADIHETDAKAPCKIIAEGVNFPLKQHTCGE